MENKNVTETAKPKQRRKRKTTKKQSENTTPTNEVHQEAPSTEEDTKPPPKKRGRKPKGGKIIKNKEQKGKKNEKLPHPNIILHLKASTKEVSSDSLNKEYLTPYNSNLNKTKQLTFDTLNTVSSSNEKYSYQENNSEEDNNYKEIWEKLHHLKKSLHHNQLVTKRSACFWCSYPFDNPPIHIPNQKRGETIEVYGSFCSPECAAAFLKKEQIDESTRWERYAMLNNIYGKIYNYEKSIKPAPDPYYTLDKYHGNLNINEYRKLLFDDRLLLVVDKPLTKIVPELYEENNETPNIYGNLLNMENAEKTYRLKRKHQATNKSKILHTNFNIQCN